MTAPDDDGRVTLALDALLSNATASDLRDLRARTPVHLQDQYDAAADQIREGLERSLALGSTTDLVDMPTGDLPEWVRLGLINALVTWGNGNGRTCLHAPSPDRPEPVHASAWKPGLVVCGECVHLFRVPRSSPEDRRCDGCGTVTTPDTGGIYSCTVRSGVLTYSVGACRECYWLPEKREAS